MQIVKKKGWFKNCDMLHNGTTNIIEQIAKNFNVKMKAHFAQIDIIIAKKELNNFVDKYTKQAWSNKTLLQEPVQRVLVVSLKLQDKCLVKEAFQLNDHDHSVYSYKAIINNTSIVFFKFFLNLVY